MVHKDWIRGGSRGVPRYPPLPTPPRQTQPPFSRYMRHLRVEASVEVSADAKAGAPVGAPERVVPARTPCMHSSTLLDSLDTYIGIQ
jgi:hypothetical protein